LAQDTDQRTQSGDHTDGLVVAKQNTPKQIPKGVASAALLTLWLWKQRNECVFDATQPSIDALVAKIKNAAELWSRASAKGLRVVLPFTWDVQC
jgi:hypothetical protein